MTLRLSVLWKRTKYGSLKNKFILQKSTILEHSEEISNLDWRYWFNLPVNNYIICDFDFIWCLKTGTYFNVTLLKLGTSFGGTGLSKISSSRLTIKLHYTVKPNNS